MISTQTNSNSWIIGPLAVVFVVALLVRIGASIYVDEWSQERGSSFLFPDSELYWQIAESVAENGEFYDGKRYVLRAPGYPMFIAASMKIFRPTPTAVRHMQAFIGGISCVLLFFLIRQFMSPQTALLAAAIAALHPYGVLLSVVLLSESIFIPLMLVQLWCWARWINSEHDRSSTQWGIATASIGAMVSLVRPSWILATPLILFYMILFSRCKDYRTRIVILSLSGLAFMVTMSPWWIRNYRVTDRFVATTLWAGASLYDGLNPLADGASNMQFMNEPERFGLSKELSMMGEWEQDRYLRDQAVSFVIKQPSRVLELAFTKLARFWNVVPNSAEMSSRWIAAGSLVWTSLSYLMILVGLHRLRPKCPGMIVLLGPLVYFCSIHMIFVSSVRYREVAVVPAIGLMSLAIVSLLSKKKEAAAEPATS